MTAVGDGDSNGNGDGDNDIAISISIAFLPIDVVTVLVVSAYIPNLRLGLYWENPFHPDALRFRTTKNKDMSHRPLDSSCIV